MIITVEESCTPIFIQVHLDVFEEKNPYENYVEFCEKKKKLEKLDPAIIIKGAGPVTTFFC